MHKENPPNTGFTFANKLSDVAAAKRDILNFMGTSQVAQTRRNFAAEGFIDRTIRKWPKKKARYGGPTLQKTGRGKASVRVLEKTQNTVAVGSTVPYLFLHQHGIGFPVRKWLGHSAQNALRIARYMHFRLSKTMLR